MKNDTRPHSEYVPSIGTWVTNLTDVPTDQAFRYSEKTKKVKVRVQGAIESSLRKKTNVVVRTILLGTVQRLHSALGEVIEKYDTKAEFVQKFTDEQIEQFAFVFPRDKKMTIDAVKKQYSQFGLSWRQAQRIIEKNKEMYPNRK